MGMTTLDYDEKTIKLINSFIVEKFRTFGFNNLTEIQKKAIPLLIKKSDILGSAQTGTGKTAAFALPILHHLINNHKNNHKIKALIITPTRELAIQINENFTDYGKYTNIKNVVIFGGVKQGPQTNALKNGVDVLIATPGRLLDLMSQGFTKPHL